MGQTLAYPKISELPQTELESDAWSGVCPDCPNPRSAQAF